MTKRIEYALIFFFNFQNFRKEFFHNFFIRTLKSIAQLEERYDEGWFDIDYSKGIILYHNFQTFQLTNKRKVYLHSLSVKNSLLDCNRTSTNKNEILFLVNK